jgi:hypothetical protein
MLTLAAIIVALVALAILGGSGLGRGAHPLLWTLTLLSVIGAFAWGAEGMEDEAIVAGFAVVGVALAIVAWRWAAVVADERRRRAEGVPVDQWRRAGMGVQPSVGVVEFQPGQTCPLCFVEHKPTSEAAQCPACRTLVHLQCVVEMGRCPTLGCGAAPVRVDAIEVGRLPARDRRAEP